MKVNFLMVNYNDYENVKKMIDKIKEYKIIDKIVVVDNCSTDDSFNKIKKIKNIIALKSNHNGGYGYGINIGAKYLNQVDPSGIIIISNTDIIIENESCIQMLLDTFEEEIAVVAPMIREHKGYNIGWTVPTPWQDIILSIPGIYKKYQKKICYKLEEIQNKITEVEAVSGSFFLIRGNILEQIGYFDENIFLYYEENILSKKLNKLHQKTVINGNVEVFHNHSVTIDKVHTSVEKYKNLKRSQYYFQVQYNHAGFVNRIAMKMLFAFVAFCLKLKQQK